MGILLVCEVPLAAVFFLPDQRDRILNSVIPGDDNTQIRANITAQATTIAWFLVGLAALQAVSLGLAFMQICRLTETFDERLYSDSASSLLGARASPKGGSTFGDAYAGEEAQTASQRYKTGKHAGYVSVWLARAPPPPPPSRPPGHARALLAPAPL